MRGTIRIGTRGSALALTQARWVAARIEAAYPELSTELVPIRTSGDRFTDRPLASVGGKGLFVKELEGALARGEVDCAVHSLKDLPAQLTPGLVLAAVPEREEPADVLLTRDGVTLADLPRGASVGTSSPRRRALLKWLRPDLKVVALRGNVDTRLRGLAAGTVDAIVLAAAGLKRLGQSFSKAEVLDSRLFLSAVGQGALAIETRRDHWFDALRCLEHRDSADAVRAERAFLETISGSCHTPLGARGEITGGILALHGLIAHPNGKQVVRGLRCGPRDQAERLGKELAEELLANGGQELLDAAALEQD